MAGAALGYRVASGMLTIDSYYLAVLLEYGFIGFILYYGMLAISIWIAGTGSFAKNTKGELTLLTPLMLSLINFCIIKSVFSEEGNHPLVFMMMAMTAALAFRQKNPSPGVP
jgi:O-antigen ligase